LLILPAFPESKYSYVIYTTLDDVPDYNTAEVDTFFFYLSSKLFSIIVIFETKFEYYNLSHALSSFREIEFSTLRACDECIPLIGSERHKHV